VSLALAPSQRFSPPGWLLGLALLVGFATVGPALGGAARPLYVVSCLVVGWLAWRRGPADHVQTMLLLFVFTPFVRRLVDVVAGYDTSGVMVVGPLVAMMPPLLHLPALLARPATTRHLSAFFLFCACVGYAMILTLAQGEWLNLARDGVKWMAPVLYAMVILDTAEAEDVLDRMADLFVFVLPVIGVYGVVQYLVLPEWDRYWMKYAPIMSIGQPEPMMVRVFSTMNAPAAYATFSAAGLLLVWFRKRGWLPQLLAAPAALGLFLSLYRTAWISMLAAMLYCLCFKSTRSRSAPLFFGIALATFGAITLTPFGDVISDRLATLTEGSQDGSARERIEEYVGLWSMPNSAMWGVGFTSVDVGTAGAMAVDGVVVALWLTMGIVVGLICLFSLGWVLKEGFSISLRYGDAVSVLLGAFATFFLAQLPLSAAVAGELGFLFWIFAGLSLQSQIDPPRGSQ
jgi:hypothetical protein